jgi:hypothetical protein
MFMKKIMIKPGIIATKLFAILFIFGNLHISAQRKPPHEFFVYADGGISFYSFQPSTKDVSFTEFKKDNVPGFKTKSSLGFSSDLGAGFTGFLSHQIGIQTGVGFGLTNVKSKLDSYTIIPDFKDQQYDEDYDQHSIFLNYAEVYKTMFVTIPLMLQFQTKQKQYWNWTRTQKAGFYALGGIKLHFLFSNKYECSVDSLFNAAYFPQYDNWAATQKFAGLGLLDGGMNTGKLDFGVMVLFTCEAGVKWRVDNNIFVYTGAFFDCALNDPMKENRKLRENYTTSEKLKGLSLIKVSERVNLMTVGIKVRIAFVKSQRPY